MNRASPIPNPPVHFLAALATILLDWLWGIPDLSVILIPLIMVLAGSTGFLTVTLIQRFVAGDPWGAAVAKGLAMGIVAGVPFMVTGTAVGSLLLGWAGLSAGSRMLGSASARRGSDEMITLNPDSVRRTPRD